MDHAGEIAATLSGLRDDQFAIFEAPDGSFVQVAWYDDPRELHCEAVDLDAWESDRSMTDDMRRRLGELGFEEGVESPNYELETPMDDPAATHRIAGVLARTLHEVYGTSPADPLTIKVDEFG